MHFLTDIRRKDLNGKLENLHDERRKYALKVLNYVESETRFEPILTPTYLVLEGCIEIVSIEPEALIFTQKLYAYVQNKGSLISRIMFSRNFVHARDQALREIAIGFIAEIAKYVLLMLKSDVIKPQESRIFRFTADESTAPVVFPYEWLEDPPLNEE
jgi:hypothetical protein